MEVVGGLGFLVSVIRVVVGLGFLVEVVVG